MKKISILLCSLMLLCCLLFTGCTNLAMPSNKNITSNGGNVLTVGEYLYFANTYTAYSSLNDGDNNEGKVDKQALYRAKTTNGTLEFEENGTLKNLERVASKVAGAECSNIFVNGEYIYFTSPNIHKTKTSENRFDLVSFFKIKLDGTGLKELYTTSDAASKFNYVNFDEKNYCFIKDGKLLIRFELGKDTKTQLTDDLSEIVFDGLNLKKAYYTTARADDFTGNVLKTINLETGEKTEISNVINTSFTLYALYDGMLYYKKTTDIDDFYYYNDFSNDFNSEEELIYASSVTNFTVLGKTARDGQVVAYIFESQLNIKVLNDTVYSDVVVDSQDISGAPTSILTANAEYIYFASANGIFRVDYKQGNIQKISGSTDIKTDKCDIVGNYFYYYTKAQGNTTDTYYLHRVNLAQANASEIKVECVAKLDTADIKEEE